MDEPVHDQNPDALPARRNVPARAAGDETIIRDPDTGQTHFLNAAAALVWECCDGRTSVSQCEQRMRAAFDVPPGTDLAADIRRIVAGFVEKGMVVGRGPAG